MSSIILACCGADKPTLCSGELKRLLAHSTPEDHLEIAVRFRAEASEFDSIARRHEELVAYYQDDLIGAKSQLGDPSTVIVAWINS